MYITDRLFDFFVRNTSFAFLWCLLLFLSDVSFHILINLYFLSWFIHQFIKNIYSYVNESKQTFFFMSQLTFFE
jgi:hypothetical protein